MTEKMSKAEFFKMRDAQREAGELKEYEAPERKFELTPDEEAKILAAMGTQKSGIYRTREVNATRLMTSEIYEGKEIKARRSRVDEIDNVTVWR